MIDSAPDLLLIAPTAVARKQKHWKMLRRAPFQPMYAGPNMGHTSREVGIVAWSVLRVQQTPDKLLTFL